MTGNSLSLSNSSTLQLSVKCAGVAQLVERRPEEPRVGGSIPSPGTIHIACPTAASFMAFGF